MDRPLTVRTYLDFEKPIAELEARWPSSSALSGDDDAFASRSPKEVTKLQQKAHQALVDTYAKLTPWQKTQVARHPDRPHCLDYVKCADRGLHAARRRPLLRRGRRHHGRPRPLSRPPGRA